MSSDVVTREAARRQHMWAVLIIAAFTLLCYAPLLRELDGLLHWPHGHNDAVKQYLGQRILVGQELAQGRLPRWDPYSFGGRPILANPQTAVFYPGTWLFAPFPYPGTFSWNLVLHVFWFALGVYALAGLVPLSFGYRVCAGCLAAGSLYMAGHVLEGHLPHVSAASWFPWLLWAYERLHAHGDRLRSLGWMSVFAALCLLAGHGQEAYYAGLGLGLLYVLDVVRNLVGRHVWQAVSLTLAAGAAGALALAVAAVQLLPQIATLPATVRGGQLALRDAWSFSSSLVNLVQLALPFALGCYTHDNYSGPWNYWEGNLGLGLVPLVLAVLGTASHVRCRRVRKLAFLALFAVWFALGSEGRLFELLYAVVPGVGLFRAPGRMLFWFAAIVPVLTALGLSRVCERTAASAGGSLVMAAAGGVLLALLWPVTCGTGIASLLGDWARGTTATHGFVDAVLLQLGLAAVVLTLAIFLEAGKHMFLSVSSSAAVWRAALGSALTAGLFAQVLAGMHHLVFVVPAHDALPLALARAVKQAEENCPVRPCRVLAASGRLPDSAAVVSEVEKLTGYDAFQIRGFAAALSVQGTGDQNYLIRHYDRDPTAFPAVHWRNEFLDSWGVHFVVARREWIATRLVDSRGWIPVPLPARFGEDLMLLRREHPVPRYRLVAEAAGEAAPARGAGRLIVLSANPRSGRWRFRVQTQRAAQLVLAIPQAPGMVVQLNGSPVRPNATPHGCMVIDVPPGEHRVDLEYRVPYLRLGGLLTLLGLALSAAMLFSRGLGLRPRGPKTSSPVPAEAGR